MTSSTDIQHEMLLLALHDELFTSCTLPSTATVLDVGTGSGTWACQVASRFPKSRVYGIDLHQVNPGNMPTNVVFETVNVMTGFPFNTGTFDFIHSRLLIGGITDWNTYLTNLHRITKRGGYVECIELELCPIYHGQGSHSELHRWTTHMADILCKEQLKANVAEQLGGMMELTGFSEVKEIVVETPIGAWPEDEKDRHIGSLALEFSKVHIVDWVSNSLLSQGIDKSEIERSASAVLTELAAPDLHASFRWRFVTGRK